MVERIQGPTPSVCSITGGTYLIYTRYEGCVTNWWRLPYFGRDLEFLVGGCPSPYYCIQPRHVLWWF